MTTDNGGAPCVWRRTLSLAICKPKIRKSAQRGDAIIAFGGRRLGARLIYAAVVTEKPKTGEYYSETKFHGRPDCIYRKVRGKVRLIPNPRYHAESDQLARDVGLAFEKADVILSRDFRYFGATMEALSAATFPQIAALLANLTQGHRVNHSPELRAELLEYLNQIWSRFPAGKLGDPSDRDTSLRCNTESAAIRCAA